MDKFDSLCRRCVRLAFAALSVVMLAVLFFCELDTEQRIGITSAVMLPLVLIAGITPTGKSDKKR